MKTSFIFSLLLAIATPCCLGQVYRTVDSPKVYGESADNKADHYNVRLTAENTYITRAERDFKNTDNFYLSTNSYLVDKATGKHYNFREKNLQGHTQTWAFEPLPKSCTAFTLINVGTQTDFDLNNADGRKVVHAGRRDPSATTQAIFDDLSDLISTYYEELGSDEKRGIFYMHRISDLTFSLNGTVLTLCCKTNSDQYCSNREIWFDIADASFCEETAYGTFSGEREKGPQKFIHITCPSGIFIRDVWESEMDGNTGSPLHVKSLTEYYLWTGIPALADKFLNGLLWIQKSLSDPSTAYSNLSVLPAGVKPRKVDCTGSQNNATGGRKSSANATFSTGSAKSRTFYPGNATIVDADGSHNFSSYDCPAMTVTDNRSSVAVTWGGDRVTLPQTDTSTYSATGYTSRGNLTIKAMRSSRNGQIYLVTVSMPNPTPGVSHITINFKP